MVRRGSTVRVRQRALQKTLQTRVGEGEGWAGSDELGGALLTSFLQARDHRYAFHGWLLSRRQRLLSPRRRRFIALALDSHGGGHHVGQPSGRGPNVS